MLLKNLELENLKRDALQFEAIEVSRNEIVYVEMLRFFQKPEPFNESDLVTGGYLIYGLMPTMMNMNLSESSEVVSYLNKARTASYLSIDEIKSIKKCLNNSLVGASKILHFINPKVYAIWDSRIFRYITEKKTTYGIDSVETYLAYLDKVRRISKEEGYSELHELVSDKFKYEMQPTRVMELVMFQTDKKNKRLYR